MAYKKSNNIDVKKINKNIIYKYILENKKVSKNSISVSLNISMPTVWQNLKELLDNNLIEEVGEFESSGGRKAKAISIVENAKFAVGVDITKNHISMVLVNLVVSVVKNIRLKKFADVPIIRKEIMNLNKNPYLDRKYYQAYKIRQQAKIEKSRYINIIVWSWKLTKIQLLFLYSKISQKYCNFNILIL